MLHTETLGVYFKERERETRKKQHSPFPLLYIHSFTVESDDAETSSESEEDSGTASTAHTGPEWPEHTAEAANWNTQWSKN